MSDQPSQTPQNSNEDPIRPHSFDGIQEYDKRLPNWWLWTLYLAVIFAFAYWFWYHWPTVGGLVDQGAEAELELNRIQMAALASGGGEVDDDQIWKMSQDSATVASGKIIFISNCAACHGPELKGGIGPNLVDTIWIHGGKPTQVVQTITNGVLEKGMPQWGKVLGRKRILEVAAFVMSHHTQDEIK